MESVSKNSQTLQEKTSIDEFFNVVATETLALFEHLELEFLREHETSMTYSEDIQFKQFILAQTYNRRTKVERTKDAVKDCGSGRYRPEAAPTHECRCTIVLSLRLVIVIGITNYKRGDNPGSTVITV